MSIGDKTAKVKETAAEKKSAEIAGKKWADWKTRYKPLEERFVNRLTSMGSAALENQVAGKAAATARQTMQQPTFDPNKGAFVGGLGVNENAETAALTNAVRTGRTAVQDQADTGLEVAMGIGRNQEQVANQSLNNLADMQIQDETSRVMATNTKRAARDAAIGKVVTTAVTAGMGGAFGGAASPGVGIGVMPGNIEQYKTGWAPAPKYRGY